MASSSSVAPNKEYEVFISFRGSDVRQGLLSHLNKALLDQKIEVFVDEQLDRGEEISESLLKLIEQSCISIVIFSQNYADSKWCLEELLKIVQCRNSTGQKVIPVFYGVDPSDVQELTGSYGDAMARHRTQFDESLVKKWGSALKDTASLSGNVSFNFKDDSALTQATVEEVLEILDRLCPSAPDRNDGFIGIESRVGKVKSLLCGSEHVSVVGIWGVGGIGKTTLAQATFDRICSRFDSQCFLRNVRENCEKSTPDAILEKVVSKLLGTSNCNTIRRLSCKKVILVLDDVSDFNQIELIMRYKDDFGPGSRIIVTSRDRHLLEYLGAEIYAVEELDNKEALQLLCLHAFKTKVPPESYSDLSERAVKYAKGLPLALKVLGCNLFQRSAEKWKDELKKLEGTSDKNIQRILRISYDGLSGDEKEIFLDIACCFKGRRRDEVESLLDVRGPKIGISRLDDMALISTRFGYIEMHDLIQQMGRDIVCEEKTPGKRIWLWDPEEICFVLRRETGTEAVRGITLNMSKIKNMNLSPSAFWKLCNLRYLKLYSFGKARLCIPHGLEYLPEQLRYLHWDQYPFKSLSAISCCAEKIFAITMHGSQLEELWDSDQDLPNLQKIDLSGSTKLTKVPDLSTASNLASLNLNSCGSLVEISRLESLPDDDCGPKSLSLLDISYCKSLQRLPQYLGNLRCLTKLYGDGSGVKILPPSINNLRGLGVLSFAGCKGLILSPLGRFPKLYRIDLSDCDLSEFPAGDCSMPSLMILNLRGNNFESIPESIQHLLNLRDLILSNCKKLNYLPVSLKSLPSLKGVDLTGCTSLYQNSNSIDRLTAAFIEERRLEPEYKESYSIENHKKWFIFPESELWEVMKYKNELLFPQSGPSFFFSFKLLEDVGYYGLLFNVCFALDNPDRYHRINVELADKYAYLSNIIGRCFLPIPALSTGGDRGRHMALCQIRFGGKIFAKGWTYTVRIHCQSSPNEFPGLLVGVSKCGLLPSFDHEIISDMAWPRHPCEE